MSGLKTRLVLLPLNRRLTWKSPGVIGGLLLAILALGGIIGYLNNSLSAAYLVLNGQRVGLVQNPDAGKALVEDILKKRGQGSGEIAKTHDQIDYQNVRVKKAAFFTQEVKESRLASLLTSYVDGCELLVNDQRLAILPGEADVQKVLKEYEDYLTKPSDSNKVTSVSIAENIQTRQVETQAGDVQLPDAVLKTLQGGQTVINSYTVQANDSWWLIARKNDMKTKEVLAGNPGMTEDSKIQPGQVIQLVSVVPYLTVLSKGIMTTTETIPFSVVTKTDYSLGGGETVVTQPGRDGSKIVAYSYAQKNGKNVAKTVLNEKVTTAAVAQIVAEGPAKAPLSAGYVSRGSGKVSGLDWPLRGGINSYYGYRHGGFHTGIDISGDKGDPYTAAASGKVVAAGWDGGYGNMILIDHGNGVLTRYAHSSKILVSVGQQVEKGQTIGLVGATGNATGPHLHFEVISNGGTLNPLDYLP